MLCSYLLLCVGGLIVLIKVVYCIRSSILIFLFICGKYIASYGLNVLECTKRAIMFYFLIKHYWPPSARLKLFVVKDAFWLFFPSLNIHLGFIYWARPVRVVELEKVGRYEDFHTLQCRLNTAYAVGWSPLYECQSSRKLFRSDVVNFREVRLRVERDGIYTLETTPHEIRVIRHTKSYSSSSGKFSTSIRLGKLSPSTFCLFDLWFQQIVVTICIILPSSS